MPAVDGADHYAQQALAEILESWLEASGVNNVAPARFLAYRREHTRSGALVRLRQRGLGRYRRRADHASIVTTLREPSTGSGTLAATMLYATTKGEMVAFAGKASHTVGSEITR